MQPKYKMSVNLINNNRNSKPVFEALSETAKSAMPTEHHRFTLYYPILISHILLKTLIRWQHLLS